MKTFAECWKFTTASGLTTRTDTDVLLAKSFFYLGALAFMKLRCENYDLDDEAYDELELSWGVEVSTFLMEAMPKIHEKFGSPPDVTKPGGDHAA